jgi:hypothetical protein
MEAQKNEKAMLEDLVKQQRSKLAGSLAPGQYLGLEDFVLQNGKEFQLAPYTEDLPGEETGKGECFKNAYQTFISAEKLRYVEGFASVASVRIPLLHAWCVDKNGKVFDPTWKDGVWYFGVVFNLDYISAVQAARGKYGVIHAWDIHCPLISGKHKYLGDGLVEYDREELLNANRYDEE